jgi:hypothetical protein
MTPPCFAGLLGLGAPELLIIMVLGATALAALIVVVALAFKYTQRRLWHETARVALEKGQPLPPYPGAQKQENENAWHEFARSQMAAHSHLRSNRWRCDLRGGLVLIAFGLAVYAARPPNWTTGWNIAIYVPSFIGGALLLNALLGAVFPPKEADTSAHSPQRDAS